MKLHLDVNYEVKWCPAYLASAIAESALLWLEVLFPRAFESNEGGTCCGGLSTSTVLLRKIVRGAGLVLITALPPRTAILQYKRMLSLGVPQQQPTL